MNRLEYLTQLRRSLEDGGLAEDEINDAMGFYEEIFLDAGAAHEAETAANLAHACHPASETGTEHSQLLFGDVTGKQVGKSQDHRLAAIVTLTEKRHRAIPPLFGRKI